MKLRELVVAQEALQRLLSLELQAAKAFQIARAVRDILMELEAYEQQRIALVRRLGERDKTGQVSVLPEKMAEFDSEIGTLLDVDIELEIPTISPSILGEANVRPVDLMPLWFLFGGEDETD